MQQSCYGVLVPQSSVLKVRFQSSSVYHSKVGEEKTNYEILLWKFPGGVQMLPLGGGLKIRKLPAVFLTGSPRKF